MCVMCPTGACPGLWLIFLTTRGCHIDRLRPRQLSACVCVLCRWSRATRHCANGGGGGGHGCPFPASHSISRNRHCVILCSRPGSNAASPERPRITEPSRHFCDVYGMMSRNMFRARLQSGRAVFGRLCFGIDPAMWSVELWHSDACTFFRNVCFVLSVIAFLRCRPPPMLPDYTGLSSGPTDLSLFWLMS